MWCLYRECGWRDQFPRPVQSTWSPSASPGHQQGRTHGGKNQRGEGEKCSKARQLWQFFHEYSMIILMRNIFMLPFYRTFWKYFARLSFSWWLQHESTLCLQIHCSSEQRWICSFFRPDGSRTRFSECSLVISILNDISQLSEVVVFICLAAFYWHCAPLMLNIYIHNYSARIQKSRVDLNLKFKSHQDSSNQPAPIRSRRVSSQTRSGCTVETWSC